LLTVIVLFAKKASDSTYLLCFNLGHERETGYVLKCYWI